MSLLVIFLCSSLYLFLGSIKDISKRNLAPTSSFRRRRGATSSTHASISITAPALPLALFHVEDEDISSCGADLRPQKRKAVDMGAGAPTTVDLFEDEVVVQEIMTILIEGGIGVALKVPRLEEIRVSTSLRDGEEEAVVNTSDDGLAYPGCGEASSSEPFLEASLTDKGKNKMPTEQDDERAGLINNECDFDLDLEDH